MNDQKMVLNAEQSEAFVKALTDVSGPNEHLKSTTARYLEFVERLPPTTNGLRVNRMELAKVIADAIGHGMRERTYRAADAAIEYFSPKPDDALANLVAQFSAALLEKLRAAEKKYGYNDSWLKDDWADDLRNDVRRHVEKGDPVDVAAYAAFAWYHGWSLAKDEKDEVEG